MKRTKIFALIGAIAVLSVGAAACGSTTETTSTQSQTTASDAASADTESADITSAEAEVTDDISAAPEEEDLTASLYTTDTVITPENLKCTEVSEEEMVKETGIDLPTPENAENVVYSVVEADELKISQMEFELDGTAYTLRACPTNLTSLQSQDSPDMDASADEILSYSTSETYGNISAFDGEWSEYATTLVNDLNAVVYRDSDGTGYVAWLDNGPGILYNLSTDNADSTDQLVETAETVFVSVLDTME